MNKKLQKTLELEKEKIVNNGGQKWGLLTATTRQYTMTEYVER